MSATYFFYDLETSGFSPAQARIMQFAGQRTDLDLQPVGEPVNVLMKLNPDVLPDPDAVLLTGITPQATLQDGLTEAEFMEFFYAEVVRPDTTFLGFNSIRFDDEFMRYLHWRNFYDPYEWQWDGGCSRWDLLDVVRMTRALRPEGIKWPVAKDGKPTNRLEQLTKLNRLDHFQAHDALSDVQATIAVARLIRDRQPELFKYLFGARGKKKVAALVQKGAPFVYTSGRYGSAYLHTTAATLLTKHPQPDAALVYDLRYDPTPFLNLTIDELIERWQFNKDPAAPPRLPVKTLKYNRCPAVAPLGVIKDPAAQQRLQLPLKNVAKHLELLRSAQTEFAKKVLLALKKLDAAREATDRQRGDVDERLYDGFIDGLDKQMLKQVRSAQPAELNAFIGKFQDARLKMLLPRYKARNFPASLSSEERAAWEVFIAQKLFDGGPSSRLAKYFGRLQQLAQGRLTPQQEYLLTELQLYGESIMPS